MRKRDANRTSTTLADLRASAAGRPAVAVNPGLGGLGDPQECNGRHGGINPNWQKQR